MIPNVIIGHDKRRILQSLDRIILFFIAELVYANNANPSSTYTYPKNVNLHSANIDQMLGFSLDRSKDIVRRLCQCNG